MIWTSVYAASALIIRNALSLKEVTQWRPYDEVWEDHLYPILTFLWVGDDCCGVQIAVKI